MNCNEENESELCGGNSLELPLDMNTNDDIVAHLSLDLDTMCLSYQLPRYLVPSTCEVTGDELPFSLDLDRRGLFLSSDNLVVQTFAERDMHIESIFQSHPSSEKTIALPKEPKTKKRKPYSKRAPKSATNVEKTEDQLNCKQSFSKDDEKENLESELKKGKSFSEPRTEDSASTFESVSFPGIAGSHAYFKKRDCVACKLPKVAFWFGDATIRKKGDKFTCADCIKNCIGEERFLSLFHIECQWTYKQSFNLTDKKPWKSLKEYIVQHVSQNIDTLQTTMQYLLDEKKYSVQKTLNKLNTMLILQKAKGDLDTLILCLRFVHDLIESLNRLAEIQAKSNLQEKYKCMDEAEKEYYQKEVEITEPLVLVFKVEAMKQFEAETARAKEQQATCITPARSFAFGIEFDETPVLGKRDPGYRNLDSFPDIEEPELDGSYKIAPFCCDYLLPQY
jgi:hypothetical protein